jgi:hypothetical protein
VATVFVLLFLFRFPILRGVGQILVVEEASSSGAYLLPLGYGEPDVVARLVRDDPACRVLLVLMGRSRLVEMGILPHPETLMRAALVRAGLPEDRLTVLRGKGRGDWRLARLLGDWLGHHPDAQVQVLCRRFAGRRFRYIFDHALPGDQARRIHVQARSETGIDETNWWQHKEGKVDIFGRYVQLAHAWLYGDDSEDISLWDPDQYEQTLTPLP